MERMATPNGNARTSHGETPPYRPLSERVLDRLPGWRWPWLVAWSMFAAVPYYLTRSDPLAPYPGDAFVITYTAGSIVVLLGNRLVSGRLDALQPTLAELLPDQAEPGRAYAAVGSVRGPLAVAVLITIAFEGFDFVAGPSLTTGVRIPLLFIGNLAGASAFWVVGALLVATYRLGARPLALRAFHLDPGLGLKAIGRLVFIGLSVVLLGFGPVGVATANDPRSLVVQLVGLVTLVGFFFLSLSSLHGQLSMAKAERLAWARRLYGQAVGPLEGGADAARLAAASPSLLAAAEIERKVMAISEWPIDDWIWRTIVAILIGASAGVVARAIGVGLAI